MRETRENVVFVLPDIHFILNKCINNNRAGFECSFTWIQDLFDHFVRMVITGQETLVAAPENGSANY